MLLTDVMANTWLIFKLDYVLHLLWFQCEIGRGFYICDIAL